MFAKTAMLECDVAWNQIMCRFETYPAGTCYTNVHKQIEEAIYICDVAEYSTVYRHSFIELWLDGTMLSLSFKHFQNNCYNDLDVSASDVVGHLFSCHRRCSRFWWSSQCKVLDIATCSSWNSNKCNEDVLIWILCCRSIGAQHNPQQGGGCCHLPLRVWHVVWW